MTLELRENVYEFLHTVGPIDWPEPRDRVAQHLVRTGRVDRAPDFTRWLWTAAELIATETCFRDDLEVLAWLCDQVFHARNEGRCDLALISLLGARDREYRAVVDRMVESNPWMSPTFCNG